MKKILSVLLTAVLLFTLAVPALAAAETEKNEYDGYPVVVVRGIAVGLEYEDGRDAFNLNTGKVIGTLLECIITRFALGNEDALYDTFAEIVDDVLEPFSCDKEGNSVYPVTNKQYTKALSEYPNFGYYSQTEGGITKAAVKKYGAENVYFFTYDYRKSPEMLAWELNSLIETAKADHNTDKVNIICASQGCIVTTAYLYYCNGYDSVNNAVYVSGAHNGLVVCGEALNGKISFNKDIIKTMVKDMAGGNMFVDILLEIFDLLGAFDALTEYFNKWVSDHFVQANDDVLRDRLGTMPGLWGFCPDEYFEGAYNNIFAGREDDYPVCETIKEVGVFNSKTEEILATAYERGVNISFLSYYNLTPPPVYDSSTMNSDSVIETVCTSNGATVALYGETLSDEYIASVADKKYISADKVIDASTALYKDYTWFVKDAIHVACDYGTEMNDFLFMLLEFEGQPTIDTFEEYPQFLVADENLDLTVLK